MLSSANPPEISTVRTSDGTHLAYWSEGEGEPAILVLPSFPFSHLRIELEIALERRFYRLLSAQRRVIRFDWRGAGSSSEARADLSLDAHCRDIHAILEHLAIDKAAIVAQRVAGIIALRYAALYPESVSSLTLLHPILRGSEHTQRPEIQARLSLRDKDWNIYANATALAHLGWSDGARGERRSEIVRDSISPAHLQSMLRALDDYDVTADVARVTAPALVLHRPAYAVFALEESSDVARRLPDAQLAFLSGASGSLIDESLDILPRLQSFLGLALDSDLDSGDGVSAAHYEDSLSHREVEILGLLAVGLSNKQIAAELNLSMFTVQRHVVNIYDKIGCHNRAAATAFAIHHGLVSRV